MTTRSHKVRSAIITALAVLIILVALVFSVFRISVPHITDYGDDIEKELSHLLGLTVEVGFVDADMYWLTPRLKLLDVNIYDAGGERHFLHFNEIHLSLAWLKTITQLQPALGFVSLSGLDLHIERKSDGNLMVQGFEVKTDTRGNAKLPPGIERFLENFSFYLFDSNLHWSDEINNEQRLDLQNINLAMINKGTRHELSMDMDLPGNYGEHVQLKAKIKGPLLQPQLWQAQLYLALEKLRLRKWFDDYWRLVDFVASGELNASIWLQLQQGSIHQVHTVMNGSELSLHYLDDEVQSWKLQRLSGTAMWQQQHDGWNAEIRNLEITRNNKAWSRPGSLSLHLNSRQNELSARAGYLRIEDLVYLTGLVNNILPDKDGTFLTSIQQYQPQGDLIDLELQVPLEYPQHIELQTGFSDIGYSTENKIPAVKGLDGHVRYRNNEAVINIDSRDVALDFHGLFRNQIELKSVFGSVVLYRKNNAWHLFSNPIDATSPHIHTLSRMEVVLADDQPPFMSLITLFDKGHGAYKSLYFPTAIMNENTVAWLDHAIVKADIPRGGFLYYGTFSDYPFNQNEGVMEALFDIENSTLQYMPDWPALENLKAKVRFHNKSMSIVNAEGSIYGARFFNTRADIAELGHAHLSINGRVDSPLADLLKFIANSPLENTLGTYLTRLQTQGRAGLDIDIQIPVAAHDPASVIGEVAFHGNEIFLPQEQYRFGEVTGMLSFTEHSVSTDNLRGTLGGSDMELQIASRDDEGETLLGITAKGIAPVKVLATPLPELVDYLDGYADVNVDIRIPLAANQAHRKLGIAVKADIDKVISTLPVPFSKQAQEPASLELAMDLFADNAMTIRLDLADRLRLDAARENKRWKVSLDSTPVKGSVFFTPDFTLDEPLRLDVDYVNLSALVSDKPDVAKQKIQPRDIPPLDINIRTLDWKQWQFRDVNLQSTRSRKGMQIDHLELHGPSISLVGKGNWQTGWRNANTTTFDFLLHTTDLGHALTEMGITQSIRKTEGDIKFNWQWHAEPYNFSWDLVQGEAQVNLKDGRLSEIEPGAGRLLGIFNFETLLSLDFGSQVSRGFAFDSMQGKVTFTTGNAFTEDFMIKGKVADIGMQGRIGLSKEDYDQIITVIPGVGSTLTLIGAVTGGPVTAAVVHFVQKMFGINRMAAYKYSVKGTWSDPDVKLLVKPDEESDG